MTNEQDTDALIAHLADRLMPVGPYRSSSRRWALWMMLACAGVAAISLVYWLTTDLSGVTRYPRFWVEWGAAIATAVSASLSAFLLGQPDRSKLWGLMPVAPFGVWIASLADGCAAALAPADGQVVFYQSFYCVRFISLVSAPLILGLLYQIRHAVAFRPHLTAGMAALGMAALAAAGLMTFRPLETPLLSAVWQFGSVAMISLLLTVAAKPLFRLTDLLALRLNAGLAA